MQLKPELTKRTTVLVERLDDCKKFWSTLDELTEWARHTREQLEEYSSAKIYTPTRFDPAVSRHGRASCRFSYGILLLALTSICVLNKVNSCLYTF